MSETKEQVKHTPGPELAKLWLERVIRAVNCHNELLEDGIWMHTVLLQVQDHLTPDERDHLGDIAVNLAKAEGHQ